MKKTIVALPVLIAFTASIPNVFACPLHGGDKDSKTVDVSEEE